MHKTLFVISDLHLGGVPGKQMCTPEGQRRLASFIHWVGTQRERTAEVHLVIAGDIVDFLADDEPTIFTANDAAAREKLQRVFTRTSEVWKALAEFTRAGGRLTLLLGNHDPELSLPGPRRLLHEMLPGPNVDFIYDGQACWVSEAQAHGSGSRHVLIEHGERFDPWNWIPHDELRAIRSALSRGEVPPDISEIPGSRLVVEVMNELKRDHAFVDLLKPETEAAIPFLVVLKPEVLAKVRNVLQLYVAKLRRGAGPRFKTGSETSRHVERANETLRLSLELAGASPMGKTGAPRVLVAFVDLWLAARQGSRATQEEQLRRLRRALLASARDADAALHVNVEQDDYLEPARQLARRGFKYVIFGHTHLVKRARINETGCYYLNTGTWADLMWVPREVYGDDEAAALESLRPFANALVTNNLQSLRRQFPTYARVDFASEDERVDGDVFLFRDSTSQLRVPDQHIWSLV